MQSPYANHMHTHMFRTGALAPMLTHYDRAEFLSQTGSWSVATNVPCRRTRWWSVTQHGTVCRQVNKCRRFKNVHMFQQKQKWFVRFLFATPETFTRKYVQSPRPRSKTRAFAAQSIQAPYSYGVQQTTGQFTNVRSKSVHDQVVVIIISNRSRSSQWWMSCISLYLIDYWSIEPTASELNSIKRRKSVSRYLGHRMSW